MKKILVLENDPVTIFIIRTILEKANWQVRVKPATEGVHALIAEFQPHVLLMGVQLMPVDGRVICQEIKLQRRYPALRIVLYSLCAFDRQSAEDCYANAFLQKPLTMQTLLQAIEPWFHGASYLRIP